MQSSDERRRKDAAYRRSRRARNPAGARKRAKQYYWRHRDRIRAKVKLLRQTNPEKINGPQYRWRKKNPDRYRLIKIRSYRKHRERLLSHHKEYRDRLRKEAIAHYGGQCICCHETEPQFLAFDHVNNDGYRHRRSPGVSSALAIWLKKNNYPSFIQLLCHNCNLAKQFYGSCPHQSAS